MKIKPICLLLSLTITVFSLYGCSPINFSEDKTVTLTMWHVYGSQTKSPMNDFVDKFNKTVGKENNIQINVTSVSNSSAIHDDLISSSKAEPGSGTLPDLFVCYPKTAISVGTDLLLDWNDYFTKDEKSEYISSFIKEGTIDGQLTVFPIAKSSEVMFINDTIFSRFSKDTGITYENLDTYEGLFEASKKYYEWSGGKAFLQYDSLFNYAMINTISGKSSFFQDENINYDDSVFKNVWSQLSESAINGSVIFNDSYATTALMTGEGICGIESTASILYYKDTLTYPDNTTEPLKLKILPTPHFKGYDKYVIQRGVGLCALKGDKKKESAAAVFCKWITNENNNMDFVTQSGYIPVKKTAFDKLNSSDIKYKDERYSDLYQTIKILQQDYTFYTPPTFEGYGSLEKKFDSSVKKLFNKNGDNDKKLSDLIQLMK